MKKILVILGGGRPKGNTRQLVDAFMQGASDAGHEVELISLNKIEVKGCIGCIPPSRFSPPGTPGCNYIRIGGTVDTD